MISGALRRFRGGPALFFATALPVVLALGVVICVRALLRFQFPVPWPDETAFASAALNLARHGTLFVPGLNPDRTIMWMPPAYMILLAAFIRVFGYSFALVRWVSDGFTVLSLILTARIAWRMVPSWPRVFASCAVMAAFVSPSMLVVANLGRMETFLCATMLCALLAGIGGRLYVMAALVAGAALIHFNAVYFVPAVVAVFADRLLRGALVRPRRGGWVALFLCAVSMLAYAVYVAVHWQGFRADMHFQFAEKALYARLDNTHPEWMLIGVLAVLALRAAWVRRVDQSMLVALFGAGFIFMAHFGHETWYDYGQPLGFCLLCIAGLSPLRANDSEFALDTRAFLSVAAFVMLCAAAVHVPPHLAELLPNEAMFSRDVVQHSEIKRVEKFIETLPQGASVDFGLSGMESFFLLDLDKAGAHWSMMNHSMTERLPFQARDWQVLCNSSEIPPGLLAYRAPPENMPADTGCSITKVR